MSRLAPEKDLGELFAALQHHLVTWPDEEVHLVIAGDGPMRASLEGMAKDSGYSATQILGFA